MEPNIFYLIISLELFIFLAIIAFVGYELFNTLKLVNIFINEIRGFLYDINSVKEKLNISSLLKVKSLFSKVLRR
jgi:hypothetical protein